jgi:hypothetical protein
MLDAATALVIDLLESRGINLTPEQVDRFKEFIAQAEQTGLSRAEITRDVRKVLPDAGVAFTDSFQLVFAVVAGIALIGALLTFVLVRREDRVETGPIFGRRSRWIAVTSGRSPAITRRQPPATEPVSRAKKKGR